MNRLSRCINIPDTGPVWVELVVEGHEIVEAAEPRGELVQCSQGTPGDFLAHLYSLLGDAVLLPYGLGIKFPPEDDWHLRTFADTKKPEYQRLLLDAIGRGGNLGARLGLLSNRLVSIDIDDDELAGSFLADNPRLAGTLRTRGRRGCNFWVRLKFGTAYPNSQGYYNLKTKEGNKYGEWRVGGGEKGAQTVIFGVHPQGDLYQTLVDAPPIEIDFAELKWFGPAPGEEPESEPIPEGFSPIQHLARGLREEDILVGNRFLERRSTLDLIAQSGIGKSSAAMQVFNCWACGVPGAYAFDLNAFNEKPLRIVMIQNEDSLNDLYFQSMVLDGLNFNRAQRELIHLNFKTFTVRGKLGLKAIEMIRRILDHTKGCDVLALNPMSAYAEGDLVRTEDCVAFLYGLWSPLLDDYDCGGVLLLHTPKMTGGRREAQKKWTTYDYMYSVAGAATITNHARGVITVDPVGNSTTFAWRVAKRFAESGWPSSIQHYKHKVLDGGCKLWVPASAAEGTAARAGKTLEDLYKLSPVIGAVPKGTFELELRNSGFIRDEVRGLLAQALDDSTPDALRLYEWSVYNPLGGPKKAISQFPQPANEVHAVVKEAKDQERKAAAKAAKTGLK